MVNKTNYLKTLINKSVKVTGTLLLAGTMNTCISPGIVNEPYLLKTEDLSDRLETKTIAHYPEQHYEWNSLHIKQTDINNGFLNGGFSIYNIRITTELSSAVQKKLRNAAKEITEKLKEEGKCIDEEDMKKYIDLIEKYGYTLADLKDKEGNPIYLSQGNGLQVRLTQKEGTLEFMRDTDGDLVPDIKLPETITEFKLETAKAIMDYIQNMDK